MDFFTYGRAVRKDILNNTKYKTHKCNLITKNLFIDFANDNKAINALDLSEDQNSKNCFNVIIVLNKNWTIIDETISSLDNDTKKESNKILYYKIEKQNLLSAVIISLQFFCVKLFLN